MRDLPPFSALRAFEAAGRRRNISEAARELYVTHGAISKQVKALEESLGVPLTRRAGRGIELTAKGRQLIPHLTRVLDDLDGALRAITSERFEGELIVSCMPGLAATWLIPKLPLFFESFPDISVTLLSASNEQRSAADLEILYGRPEWPDRNIRLLKTLDVFPVCSPRIMNGPEPIRKIDDLYKHVLIDEPGGAHWREFLVAQGRDPSLVRKRLRFEAFNQGILAARDGLGVAIGDGLTMASDLATGRLVRPLPAMVSRRSLAYYLVTVTDQPVTGPMAAFTDWLTSEIQRTAID
ncbi:LysR family transcriptional regulator [Roseovarius spongiae]|uniref:LysR family transcriptional regulator n=1 Tax=Roseovarius spongiae TaxID=2320272 RepID=A0A3A8AYI1_9RHOB|nr:LysR substrate-binding domain-containing protein [Roseovarius spongiae]RKF16946.1 LysR family transcriptional regulator [Roseovarius spongiae]